MAIFGQQLFNQLVQTLLNIDITILIISFVMMLVATIVIGKIQSLQERGSGDIHESWPIDLKFGVQAISMSHGL